jgi:hypothetical protein
MHRRISFGFSLLVACASKNAPGSAPSAEPTACMGDGVTIDQSGASRPHADALHALASVRYDAPLAWTCQGSSCAAPSDQTVHVELTPTGEPCAILDCSGLPDAVATRPRAEREKACARALAIDVRASVRTSDATIEQQLAARLISRAQDEAQLFAVVPDVPLLHEKLRAAPSHRAQLTLELRDRQRAQRGTLRVAVDNPTPTGAVNMAGAAWEARWTSTPQP